MGFFDWFFSKKSPTPQQKSITPQEPASPQKPIISEESAPPQKHIPLEERELVIGFDFGTAFTKVVIRDLALRSSYAVNFGCLGAPDNKYLIPVETFLNSQNEIVLTENQGNKKKNFKSDLVEKCQDRLAEAEIHSTAFVGLTLIKAREWFFSNIGDRYENIQIIWNLNIGIPSRWFDDDETCNRFKAIGLGGWILSQEGATTTFLKAHNSLTEAKDFLNGSRTPVEALGGLHPECVYTTPEIIAELVGYSKSYQRNFGLHMIIDIGASTFDISTFVLHDREGDNYSILTSEVYAYGVLKYEKVKTAANSKLEEFKNKCLDLIRSVVSTTRQSRDPNSPAWKNGMPLFICGGGSLIGFYSEVFRGAEEIIKRNFSGLHLGFPGFRIIELPIPKDLKASGIPQRSYHRLGVAYGLSFGDIGEITPPGKIEDLEKPVSGQSPSNSNYDFKKEYSRNRKYQEKERGW